MGDLPEIEVADLSEVAKKMNRQVAEIEYRHRLEDMVHSIVSGRQHTRSLLKENPVEIVNFAADLLYAIDMQGDEAADAKECDLDDEIASLRETCDLALRYLNTSDAQRAEGMGPHRDLVVTALASAIAKEDEEEVIPGE